VEALVVPSLHPVGLFLRMSALLDQSRTQANNTQTSPPDQKAARIVSRLHTLENESKICRQAFLPGVHITVPALPNVTAVNALGDFSIARNRLAIIDGEGTTLYSNPGISHLPPIRLRAAALPTPIRSVELTSAHTTHRFIALRYPALLCPYSYDPVSLTG
jgi:hypothetical protein